MKKIPVTKRQWRRSEQYPKIIGFPLERANSKLKLRGVATLAIRNNPDHPITANAHALYKQKQTLRSSQQFHNAISLYSLKPKFKLCLPWVLFRNQRR